MPETTTPPPAAEQGTPPPASAGASFDQSFPDDGLDTPPTPPPPPPPEAPEPPEPPPSGEPKGEKPPEKPKTEGTAPKKPGDTAPPVKPSTVTEHDFTPPQVAKPNELRNWAQRMGSRAQKAEFEIQKLQTKLAQIEAQPPKSEDATNLASELTIAKKRLEQYENDIRLTKYERSQEYAEKYQKPYQDSVARAYREVKELLVTENNADGDPVERVATQADFDEIYSLPLGQATKLARLKFGDAATVVLQHRQQIRQLAESAYAAVEDYKAKAGEFETRTKAEQAQHQQQLQQMFSNATNGHAQKSPDIFLERDGDSEGNQLLEKGRSFANSVFGGNDSLTPQQIAFRDAMAYNRLSAYPRLLRDVKKLETALSDATKTIEELRSSGPGAPGAGTRPPPNANGYKPFDEAFDEKVPA